MRLKQLCTRKVRDFAMALPARKVSGAFKKRPPGFCTIKQLPSAPVYIYKTHLRGERHYKSEVYCSRTSIIRTRWD